MQSAKYDMVKYIYYQSIPTQNNAQEAPLTFEMKPKPRRALWFYE